MSRFSLCQCWLIVSPLELGEGSCKWRELPVARHNHAGMHKHVIRLVRQTLKKLTLSLSIAVQLTRNGR